MKKDKLRKEYDQLFIKYLELELNSVEGNFINRIHEDFDNIYAEIERVIKLFKKYENSKPEGLDDEIIQSWGNLSNYGKAMILSRGYEKKNMNTFVESFYKLKAYKESFWDYYGRTNYHIVNKRKVRRYPESKFMRLIYTENFKLFEKISD